MDTETIEIVYKIIVSNNSLNIKEMTNEKHHEAYHVEKVADFYSL